MVSRKQFIESEGATCANWTWSWSFVNHNKKFVVFGVFDTNERDGVGLILSSTWEYKPNGSRRPGYAQSKEHVRLIQEEGYGLFTFPQKYSDEYLDKEGIGPSKIAGFTPNLTQKGLLGVGGEYYSTKKQLGSLLPEELNPKTKYYEGASKLIYINSYERSSDARRICIEHFGFKCSVCEFDFEKFYGDLGSEYIHVHHIKPLAETNGEYLVDPINDLVPVCPNCHAMIHKTQPALTIDQLRKHIAA